MPLLQDPRGDVYDPQRQDDIISQELEGISGRSQEFSTPFEMIYPPYQSILSNGLYNWGSGTYYSKTTSSDYVLRKVFIQQMSLATGTTSFALTINGQKLFNFSGGVSWQEIDVGAVELKAQSKIEVTLTGVSVSAQGFWYLIGYPI